MDMSHPNTNVLTIAMPPDTDSETDSKLPPELYSYIIDCIDDKPTLLSLMASSKAVHSQAERKLYRSIRLEKSMSHSLFLKSILDKKRPHLACLVHRYSLCQAPVINDEFNALLTRALVTLVNLKYLSFKGVIGIASAQVLPIGTVPPFQLHTFHWAEGGEIPLLGPFLEAQHSLEVLSLLAVFKPPSLSITSLQNLRKIAGSTNVITSIVPGRQKITCVEWSASSLPVPVPPINVSLFPSSTRIRVLSFGVGGVRPLLQAIVVLLGHLEILEVGTFYATELDDLYKLTRLRTLVITNSGPGYGVSINPQEIFNEMKSLGRIDLGYFDALRCCQMYKRWVRGAEEPTRADGSEVVWWSSRSEM